MRCRKIKIRKRATGETGEEEEEEKPTEYA